MILFVFSKLTYQQMRQSLIFFCLFLFVLSIPCKSESPYKLKPTEDYLILGAGAATGISTYFIFNKDRSLSEERIADLSRSDINSFDRSAVNNWSPEAADFSEVAMWLSVSALIPLATNTQAWNDALTIGVMSAETIIWALSLPQLSKITTSRSRPYVYNEMVDESYKLEARANESFFSRTTTVAFASAVFSATLFDAYYPDSPYSKPIWVGLLTCASIAGYLKFQAGQHFPTDIITGAVVGSFIGWFVPYMHRNQRNDSMSFGIFPATDGIRAAMVLKL